LAGGLALPFVEFRANRIVDGTLLRVWQLPAVWAWLALGIVALAIPVAIVSRPWRGNALLGLGAAAFCAWAFAVGGAAAALMPRGDTIARVSISSGAWLILVGAAVIWFQGAQTATLRGARTGAAAAALVATVVAWFAGGLPQLSLVLEYNANSDTFWLLTGSHAALSVGGTAIAVVLGVPLGIAAARVTAVRVGVIPAAGIIQTIPSLALYGLLVVPLGMLGLPTLGAVPALIALTLYALLPIVRNTYLGVSGVDPAILDAGRGMGMRPAELLWRVELPLALPLLLEGVRASLVMTIGVAAVMAIIGARTLGTLVFLGWGEVAVDLVLLGALPMVVLSILADRGMRALERTIVSPGIRIREEKD
jgi:osmoprotectant transport system permease protein